MKRRWPMALVLQACSSIVFSALMALSIFWGRFASLALTFFTILTILAGAWTAFFVTRRGLSNYLAWILPPVCMAATPWLILGYPPDAGHVMLCALISLVGAATGDVVNRRKGR